MRRVVSVPAFVALALILASCAATTDPATNVTSNRAILRAHGHTDSTPASYYFAYAPDGADLGTQEEFDTQLVVVPPGAHGPNGEDIPFAAPTVTLRPDTTYHFRVCGGDDHVPFPTCANTRTFTTPPNPDVTLKSTQYGTTGSCCVGTADFNRDGILDLVTSGNVNQAFARAVSVRFGDGSGGFGAEQEFGPQAVAEAIAAGDFNRDGKKDVAYLGGSGLNVLLGDGNGGFSAGPQSPAGCRFTETRDVNRDGKLDLIGIGGLHLSSWACVSFGDGAGGFSSGNVIDPDERPLVVTVADVTRDGRPDLVVGTAGLELGGPTGVSVLPGTSAGTFGPPLPTTLPSGTPIAIVVADFNRDGIPDAVVSTQAGGGQPGPGWLLAGTSNGRLAAPVPVPNLPESVLAAGDLDGNGTPDLVSERAEFLPPSVVSGSTLRQQLIFRVLPGKGDGTFKAPNDSPAGPGGFISAFFPAGNSLLVADFDRDARPDVATAAVYDSRIVTLGVVDVGLNTTAR
jgi:hypothetical protein